MGSWGPKMPRCGESVALYVHVPFCRARCAYCDFNTYAGLEALMPPYVAAVCQEIRSSGERWGFPKASTVYFGGGTPSVLPLHLLAKVSQEIQRVFRVSRDAEITLEANPGTVTQAYLLGLRELGVNRLSLGVQSAHDDELRFLGRIHTWAQAVEAVGAARAAGFDNLNLDLIFGLPGQTLARWRETLEAGVALGPEHLSLYGLTVEEETPLHRRIAGGKVLPPDQDLAAEMYTLAERVLAEVGFFHYEISNWAQASRYVCRHNLTYWRNDPWLGVGAGAHSWLDGRRWGNVRHPEAYIAAWQRGDMAVDEIETIDRALEMGETMMLGLRTAEGVDTSRFRARFGIGLEAAFGEQLTRLRNLGLVHWDGHTARLTARGRLLGNQVFMVFV